jgi:hypothetical protein
MQVFIDMKLTSTDGIELNLKILGYEFPEIKNGIDSNWLKLNLEIKGRGINLNETDPSLQASELEELTRWMMMLILGKLEVNQYWQPLEGNLTFEFGGKKENIYLIRIYTHENFSVGLNCFSLDFLYTDRELALVVKSLRRYQKDYPVRDTLNRLPPSLSR